MGLNQHNIDQLVEKFWRGETSLEEEATLSEFFAYNEIPEKYEGAAAYFEMINEENMSLELDASFDEKILAEIEGKSKPKGAIVYLKPFFQAAAAVAAVLVLTLLVTSNNNDNTLDASSTAASDENVLHDPQVYEAFEQTRSALFMVSSKLNKGHDQSLKLSKFNEAQQTLKSDSDEKDN